jgi:hypothetical protein
MDAFDRVVFCFKGFAFFLQNYNFLSKIANQFFRRLVMDESFERWGKNYIGEILPIGRENLEELFVSSFALLTKG